MGHVGRIKEEYRALVHRLQANTIAFPEPENEQARRAWQEILELLYTPEEAAFASRLPLMPSSLDAVARRVGMAPEQAKPRLDALCDKGLALDLTSPTTGKTVYMLAPPVIGFFEFSQMRAHESLPQKEIAEAIHAYVHGDSAFIREIHSFPTVIGRALPYESALGDEEMPDVLDWERATLLIRGARSLAVSLCYCRHIAEHLGQACKAPMENCLSLNAGADFVVHRKFGRAISVEEGLDVLAQAREHGLVHIADNVLQKPAYICNCCGCCCGQLHSINEYGLRGVNPSGFEASPDEASCVGCSRCARACPIGAITMVPHRVEGRIRAELKPSVNFDGCIGCGVCAGACRKGAMTLSRRTTPPAVPANTVEKALRMVIERGRLAHLLFDEGASRGARFLNRAVSALLALPPAQRALASDQVRSRFVRFAMTRFADPTA